MVNHSSAQAQSSSNAGSEVAQKVKKDEGKKYHFYKADSQKLDQNEYTNDVEQKLEAKGSQGQDSDLKARSLVPMQQNY